MGSRSASESIVAACDAAREAAWQSHVNFSRAAPYIARREAWDRLRDELQRVDPNDVKREAVIRPHVALVIAAAVRLAVTTPANVSGLRYWTRKRLMAELRGCVDAMDRWEVAGSSEALQSEDRAARRS